MVSKDALVREGRECAEKAAVTGTVFGHSNNGINRMNQSTLQLDATLPLHGKGDPEHCAIPTDHLVTHGSPAREAERESRGRAEPAGWGLGSALACSWALSIAASSLCAHHKVLPGVVHRAERGRVDD